MCCAQTAAPEEKKKDPQYMANSVYCSLSCTPASQKKHRKIRPRSFQNAPQSLPNGLKIDPGTSFDSQEAPKSTKDAPKTGPRVAQERPRAAQERPSVAQETLWRAQDPPKSKLRGAKIDVEKPDVFSIDFGRVRTSFWKGF